MTTGFDIYMEMLTGYSDRPAEEILTIDEGMPVDPDLEHIFLPITYAGIGFDDALRLTNQIAQVEAGAFLNEEKTIREQASARDLMSA